ncbi:hypothetical protein RJ641_011369 [Dillenia turbinata]|uniref:Uncharacterized protein n=1 Tax=Dillenia turbinata TaxID=194707 RepID=A0AAN8UW19_9MAGN
MVMVGAGIQDPLKVEEGAEDFSIGSENLCACQTLLMVMVGQYLYRGLAKIPLLGDMEDVSVELPKEEVTATIHESPSNNVKQSQDNKNSQKVDKFLVSENREKQSLPMWFEEEIQGLLWISIWEILCQNCVRRYFFFPIVTLEGLLSNGFRRSDMIRRLEGLNWSDTVTHLMQNLRYAVISYLISICGYRIDVDNASKMSPQCRKSNAVHS